jgi:twitching motility protein PilT
VTGRTGAGKSTTLAAMVDTINRTTTRNVISVEDPIEFLHVDRMSFIHQREIGLDTPRSRTAQVRATPGPRHHHGG